MIRLLFARILCVLWLVSGVARAAEPGTVSRTIGIEGDVSVTLDRGDYLPRPLDDRTPLVLRVEKVTPREDGRFTYDFHYMGFEPGEYMLADYLMLADGGDAKGIGDEILLVRTMLPANHDGTLDPYVARPFPWFGGYRLMLGILAFLWVAGIAAFIYFGRKKKPKIVPVAIPPQPTFAERIRPYVEQAADGKLSANDKAKLERLLTRYWRERLSLREQRMAASLAELKRHDEAGALLRALERWLHRPGGATREEIDDLLAPYRKIAAGAQGGEVPA